MECIRCHERQAFQDGKVCSICIIKTITEHPHSIPEPDQYQDRIEDLVYEIGQLAPHLYPFISELGDKIEIECPNCIVEIRKKPKQYKRDKDTFNPDDYAQS
jgi:hypothetical protein